MNETFIYHLEFPELSYSQRLEKMAEHCAIWIQMWERDAAPFAGFWSLS